MLRAARRELVRSPHARALVELPAILDAKDLQNISDTDELLDKYAPREELSKRCRVTLLIVDALDEVPRSARGKIIEKAKSYAATLACSLVVMSRKIDLVRQFLHDFKKYELLPFEPRQALRILNHLVHSERQLEHLKDNLRSMQDHSLMTPLPLLLLAEAIEKHHEIPASITEVYTNYCETALGKWAEEDSGVDVLFEYHRKRRFLSCLAYEELQSKGLLALSRERFAEFFAEHATNYNWSDRIREDFISEIDRSGILRIGRHTVGFEHRLLLDYFCAFHLFDSQDKMSSLPDLLLQAYFDDAWGETTFFYIGLKRQLDEELAERIISFQGAGGNLPELDRDLCKLMIGRLLQAGWNSLYRTKKSVIERSLEFVVPLRRQLRDVFEPFVVETLGQTFGEGSVDFLLLYFYADAFQSRHLRNEVQETFDQRFAELKKRTSDVSETVYQVLALYWAFRDFLPATKGRKDLAEEIAAEIDTMAELDVGQRTRITAFLSETAESPKIDRIYRKNRAKLQKTSTPLTRRPNFIKGKHFKKESI